MDCRGSSRQPDPLASPISGWFTIKIVPWETAGDALLSVRHLLDSGRIGRVAVLHEWRGRGLGRALMKAVVAETRRRGMIRSRLHARVQTIPFHEPLGFLVCGEEFEEAGILHREMELVEPPQKPVDPPGIGA